MTIEITYVHTFPSILTLKSDEGIDNDFLEGLSFVLIISPC